MMKIPLDGKSEQFWTQCTILISLWSIIISAKMANCDCHVPNHWSWSSVRCFINSSSSKEGQNRPTDIYSLMFSRTYAKLRSIRKRTTLHHRFGQKVAEVSYRPVCQNYENEDEKLCHANDHWTIKPAGRWCKRA